MPGIPEEEEELPEHMWGANSQSSGTQPAQGSASMGSNSLPAEGSESAMATVLHILASVLSINNPYDNRGYRSQIRRNLKHKLKLAGMPIPDWLESTEDMPVKDFRDRCFKWAACLKAAGKAGRSIPEPPDRCVPGSGLPAEGAQKFPVEEVMQTMSELQAQLGHWLTKLPPLEVAVDTPVDDPRKTVSEPPKSPQAMDVDEMPPNALSSRQP